MCVCVCVCVCVCAADREYTRTYQESMSDAGRCARTISVKGGSHTTVRSKANVSDAYRNQLYDDFTRRGDYIFGELYFRI